MAFGKFCLRSPGRGFSKREAGVFCSSGNLGSRDSVGPSGERQPKLDVRMCTEKWKLSSVTFVSKAPQQTFYPAGELEPSFFLHHSVQLVARFFSSFESTTLVLGPSSSSPMPYTPFARHSHQCIYFPTLFFFPTFPPCLPQVTES